MALAAPLPEAQTDAGIFTYAHLIKLREATADTRRYEIIDGVLYVSPSPSLSHQYGLIELGARLRDHVRHHKLGIVLVAPFDVKFSPRDTVQPDILYLTNEQVARVEEQGLTEPPTLVVELLSPSTEGYDRRDKRALYERQGVPHLWFLDPRRHFLDELVLRDGRYGRAVRQAANAEFRPRLFPDLVVPLAELWWPPAGLEAPAE